MHLWHTSRPFTYSVTQTLICNLIHDNAPMECLPTFYLILASFTILSAPAKEPPIPDRELPLCPSASYKSTQSGIPQRDAELHFRYSYLAAQLFARLEPLSYAIFKVLKHLDRHIVKNTLVTRVQVTCQERAG